jgi:hypothetical protein
MPHFECGAFNHSATSPDQATAQQRRALSIERALPKQEQPS